MAKILFALGLVLGLPALAGADVTKEDLKKLAAAGVSDPVIVAYVKAHGPLAKLSPEDLIELKQAGVEDRLLATVIGLPAPPRPYPSILEDYSWAPASYYELYYPGYGCGEWLYATPWCGFGFPWYGLGFWYYGIRCGAGPWVRAGRAPGANRAGVLAHGAGHGAAGAAAAGHGGGGGGHGGGGGGGGHR